MNFEYFIGFLPVIFISMARPLGLMIFLPMLAGQPVTSNLVKSSLALVIAFPIIQHHHEQYNLAHFSLYELCALAGKEISIGVLMSYVAAIPLWAIEAAGFMIDSLRGASMAEVFNVVLKSQTSTFGVIASTIITVLFLSLGGLMVLLHALYESYVTLPVFPLKLHFTEELLNIFSVQMNVFFTLMLSFSLPTILAMLFMDIVLGLINVSAKQINVFNLSLPLKSITAIFFLILTARFSIPNYLENMFNSKHVIHSILETLQ